MKILNHTIIFIFLIIFSYNIFSLPSQTYYDLNLNLKYDLSKLDLEDLNNLSYYNIKIISKDSNIIYINKDILDIDKDIYNVFDLSYNKNLNLIYNLYDYNFNIFKKEKYSISLKSSPKVKLYSSKNCRNSFSLLDLKTYSKLSFYLCFDNFNKISNLYLSNCSLNLYSNNSGKQILKEDLTIKQPLYSFNLKDLNKDSYKINLSCNSSKYNYKFLKNIYFEIINTNTKSKEDLPLYMYYNTNTKNIEWNKYLIDNYSFDEKIFLEDGNIPTNNSNLSKKEESKDIEDSLNNFDYRLLILIIIILIIIIYIVKNRNYKDNSKAKDLRRLKRYKK